MRRILWRAFNITAAVSAVLFVATCVMWVRSYWASDQFFWFGPDDHQRLNVEPLCGAIYVERENEANPNFITNEWSASTGPASSPWEAKWNVNPSRWLAVRVCQPYFNWLREPAHVVIVSDWLMSLLTAIPAVYWFVHRRRLHRHHPNVCPSCGYDLRATPDRCPECGLAPAGKVTT